MSESGPSIFRSLERTAGRGGFDTIVRAAVAAYAPLRRPSQRQAREFGGLVMPLFERTDRETRRILAASLAAASRLPRPLVERLLREPIEVVAPFLLGSPLLTEADIAFLHRRAEPALDRLLTARRPAAGRAGEERIVEPRHEPVARTEREGIARQTNLLSIGSPEAVSTSGRRDHSPRTPSPAAPSAEHEARETLRRLATTGRRPAERVPEAVEDEPMEETNDLLGFARRRDSAGFREVLARKLLISAEEAAALMAGENGRPLAAALKALGIGLADAMTILMMTTPRIGADVMAFEAMQSHYAGLDADACAARFDLLSVPAARTIRHVPQFEASAKAPRRSSPAPTFGRRKPVALDLRGKLQGR